MTIKLRGAINKKVLHDLKEWLNKKGYILVQPRFQEHNRFIHLVTSRQIILYKQRHSEHLVGYVNSDHGILMEFLDARA